MGTRVQHRRDSAVNWALNNPVLLQGEIGYDTTNKLYKIGDGTNTWETLDEFNPGSLFYMGLWDASSGAYPVSPEKGWYYVTSTAGNVSAQSYNIGDWIVWNGITWNRINNNPLIDSFILSKGNANGIASLDATGKVPSAQLPATGGGISQSMAIAMSIALG